MRRNLSKKVLDFNLRPDLYAHGSWYGDLCRASGTLVTPKEAGHGTSSKPSVNFESRELMLAGYLLKKYELINKYCWRFETPADKLAMYDDFTLINGYIIALIYYPQICRAVERNEFLPWLHLLTEPVMRFALFQAPYMCSYDLPDLATPVHDVSEKKIKILTTSLQIARYLFSRSHPGIWPRIRMNFPRTVFDQNLRAVNTMPGKFESWFINNVIEPEIGYVIH